MPPPPTSHSHAYSRVSAKESHNKPMRDLAGSVPEMLEPCRNKDCVFQGGRNREEPYIVDALNASRREESVVRPSSSAIVTGLRAIQKQRLRIGPAKRPLVRRSGTGSRFSPRHWKPLPMAKSKRKESRRRSLSYQISNIEVCSPEQPHVGMIAGCEIANLPRHRKEPNWWRSEAGDL